MLKNLFYIAAAASYLTGNLMVGTLCVAIATSLMLLEDENEK